MPYFLVAPTGHRMPLPPGIAVIGTDPSSTIPIREGMGVVDHHFMLTSRSEGLELKTLALEAQVTVNGFPSQACMLTAGDLIGAGTLQLSVDFELAAEVETPRASLPPIPMRSGAALDADDETERPSGGSALAGGYQRPSLPPTGLAASLGTSMTTDARIDDMMGRSSVATQKYTQEQNSGLAIASGIVAMIVAAFLWRFIPRFHWIILCGGAWFLGMMVGWAVRQGAAKFEPTDRFFVRSTVALAASAMAVFGCLTGDVLLLTTGGATAAEYSGEEPETTAGANDFSRPEDAELDAELDKIRESQGGDLAAMAEQTSMESDPGAFMKHMPKPSTSGIAFSAIIFLVIFRFKTFLACGFAATGAYRAVNSSVVN